jgi:hypothetical protein
MSQNSEQNSHQNVSWEQDLSHKNLQSRDCQFILSQLINEAKSIAQKNLEPKGSEEKKIEIGGPRESNDNLIELMQEVEDESPLSIIRSSNMDSVNRI